MIAVDLFRSLLDDGDVPRGEVFEADKLHMLSENGRSWHMPGVQSCLRSFSLLDERWLSMMSSTLSRGTTTDMPVFSGSCAHSTIPSGSFSSWERSRGRGP